MKASLALVGTALAHPFSSPGETRLVCGGVKEIEMLVDNPCPDNVAQYIVTPGVEQGVAVECRHVYDIAINNHNHCSTIYTEMEDLGNATQSLVFDVSVSSDCPGSVELEIAFKCGGTHPFDTADATHLGRLVLATEQAPLREPPAGAKSGFQKVLDFGQRHLGNAVALAKEHKDKLLAFGAEIINDPQKHWDQLAKYRDNLVQYWGYAKKFLDGFSAPKESP